MIEVAQALDRILGFESVAIIGASPDSNRVGGRTLRLLQDFGFRGRIVAVNPKYREVQGVECVPSVDDLPRGLDLAVSCVSAQVTCDLIPGLATKRVGAVIVFAAGFREVGGSGVELERRLKDLAVEHDVIVHGPNCMGIVSFARQRCAAFTSALTASGISQRGRTALISQSGGMAVNLYTEAASRGVRFSHLISTGNEVMLSVSDYLRYAAEDPDTDVVIAYVESVRDGHEYFSALSALQAASKPVIMLKAGRSRLGAEVAKGHIGAMAGDHRVFSAVMRRFGVIEVHSLDEVADVWLALDVPRSARLGVIANSGGTVVHLVDLCEEAGLALAELAPATVEDLKAYVPRFGRVDNPVDLTGQMMNDPRIFSESARRLLADTNVDVMLILLGGNGEAAEARRVIDELCYLRGSTSKPIYVVWFAVPATVRDAAAAAGIRLFADPRRAVQAISKIASNGIAPLRSFSVQRPNPPGRPEQANYESTLSEWEAMLILDEAGIPTPARRLVSSVGQLRSAVKEIGFPCVLKMVDPVVAHRSKIGAVRTGIGTRRELEAAFRDLVHDCGARKAIVARQLRGGVEVIAGILQDPNFGPVALVGAGGINTEAVDDSVMLVPPLTVDDVKDGLLRLRLWPVLEREGSRGIEALVQVILALAHLAIDGSQRLREIECNPILVAGGSAVAVDALAVLRRDVAGEPDGFVKHVKDKETFTKEIGRLNEGTSQ